MLGLRASARKLRDLIDPAGADRQDTSVSSETAAIVTQAIYHREMAGRSTSFRQLHHIVDLTQPEALKMVNQLRADGMVEIEQNVHDALESTITLTARTRDRLAKVLRTTTP